MCVLENAADLDVPGQLDELAMPLTIPWCSLASLLDTDICLMYILFRGIPHRSFSAFSHALDAGSDRDTFSVSTGNAFPYKSSSGSWTRSRSCYKRAPSSTKDPRLSHSHSFIGASI
ncbi:hypothetical protein HGRIS_008896 [Hohenbuehelia grisea]|uniref:Pheromone receptor n=1 Tax=Hohenbuehelia grisea TaxID=104357 RepID=A0ABR3IZZ4_9AGAR